MSKKEWEKFPGFAYVCVFAFVCFFPSAVVYLQCFPQRAYFCIDRPRRSAGHVGDWGWQNTLVEVC